MNPRAKMAIERFPGNLKKCVKDSGKKIGYLAIITGVPKQALECYIHGTKYPPCNHLIAIAICLNVSLFELTGV